ncbi:MAG: hypothetical protein ACJASX_002036 [Limisphaerales bacterium]
MGTRKEVDNPIASTDQSRVQLNSALSACFGLITLSSWIVSCKPMELPPSHPQLLNYRAAPADNPLKGFMPFRGDYRGAFPHSMEWDYFPLGDLMTGPEAFDFEVVERSLMEVSARGHQLVMRVYLDYPEKSTGVPQFLIDEGVKMRPYEDHGGGLSPDYEDERLVQALEKFIAAFGNKYDGDPRLGFLTIGLVGFWGEWHTYPHDEWMPGFSVQRRILHAYDSAFSETRMLVRRPVADSTMLSIGYHDDSFAFSTLPTVDWHFVSQLRAAGATNQWRTNPIGGELRPELQLAIWDQPIPADIQHEDFAECVKQTHASWLVNQRVFNGELSAVAHARAVAGARSLGYEYFVSQTHVPPIRAGEAMVVELALENRGVAPFYYDWPVQLRVLSQGKPVHEGSLPLRLTQVMPDSVTSLRVEILNSFSAGEYECLIRVVPPFVGAKPFRFANEELDAENWLRIGVLRVF